MVTFPVCLCHSIDSLYSFYVVLHLLVAELVLRIQKIQKTGNWIPDKKFCFLYSIVYVWPFKICIRIAIFKNNCITMDFWKNAAEFID